MVRKEMPVQIDIVEGDITRLKVNAIVNAANNSLLGGGGVDGAIHRVAGPQLLDECRTLNGCKTGEAKITAAYQLPCRYVIHTVGPVWHGGERNEAQLLASCYRNVMRLAQQHQLQSIAFPAISCGVYGYPMLQAVDIAVTEVKKSVLHNEVIEQIQFVCFDQKMADAYRLRLD